MLCAACYVCARVVCVVSDFRLALSACVHASKAPVRVKPVFCLLSAVCCLLSAIWCLVSGGCSLLSPIVLRAFLYVCVYTYVCAWACVFICVHVGLCVCVCLCVCSCFLCV
jgi:hypothetical protein